MQEMPQPPGRHASPRRRMPGPVRLPDWGDEPDIGSMMAAQQAALTDRLEAGLQAIQRRADRLMRQVGAEVYRAAQKGRGTAPPLKDDAARSILTYVDERFQSLNLAVGRLEQAVQKLAQATADVLLRTDQSRQIVDRVAQTSAEHAQRNQAAVGTLATRVDRALQPLSARLDALDAAIKASTTRNRADLTAFTQRTSEGLTRVGERLRQGFAAMHTRSKTQDEELVRDIQGSVTAEVDRLERIMREQAARSIAAAEQVSRSAADTAARTDAALEMLRDRMETGLARVARESAELVEEAAARLAERQHEILGRAIQEAETRTEHAAGVMGPDPVEDTDPAPAWTAPQTEATPGDEWVGLTDADLEDDQGDFPDLRSTIAGLDDLA